MTHGRLRAIGVKPNSVLKYQASFVIAVLFSISKQIFKFQAKYPACPTKPIPRSCHLSEANKLNKLGSDTKMGAREAYTYI